MRTVIQIILALVILFLVYMVYESIMEPVRFNKELDKRKTAVIDQLKDIRAAQITYKGIYGEYAPDFDTLINFLKTGEIPVVKIIPDPTDTTFTKTIRDTIDFINAGDSLLGHHKNFDVNNLKYIPYSQKKMFEMESGTVEKGKVFVAVVEARAPFDLFLDGLDKQLVVNLIETQKQIDKYPGLKFGSLEEPSTDGNWE